jgi:hypothetical protein
MEGEKTNHKAHYFQDQETRRIRSCQEVSWYIRISDIKEISEEEELQFPKVCLLGIDERKPTKISNFFGAFLAYFTLRQTCHRSIRRSILHPR